MKKRSVILFFLCVISLPLLLWKAGEKNGQEEYLEGETETVTGDSGKLSSIVYDTGRKKYIFNKELLENPDYMRTWQPQDVAEVPESLLPEIPTADLLEITLETPVSAWLMYYWGEELQVAAIDTVRGKCSAMEELFHREDLPETLLERYGSIPVIDENWERIFILESMIAYPAVYDTYSRDQLRHLNEIDKKMRKEKKETVYMQNCENNLLYMVEFNKELMRELKRYNYID